MHGGYRDTMEASVRTVRRTARLYNRCGPVSRSGLWPKAELSTLGSDLYSICLQNGTLIRPVDKVLINAVARLFRGVDRHGASMEEAGSGHEGSSHNILTLDALQVLSRSQVTPGVVNVHADTADM
jgi:hypothetical protein